jgi:hypothetical protein
LYEFNYILRFKPPREKSSQELIRLWRSPITLKNIRKIIELLRPEVFASLKDIADCFKEPLDRNKISRIKEYVIKEGEATVARRPLIGHIGFREVKKTVDSLFELKERLSALRDLFETLKNFQQRVYNHVRKRLRKEFPSISEDDILIKDFALAKTIEADSENWLSEKTKGLVIDREQQQFLSYSLFASINSVIALRIQEETLKVLERDKQKITDLEAFIKKEVIPPFNQNGLKVDF